MSLLSGARREFYRYEVLDTSDRVTGTLDGVTGGTLEGSIFRPVRWGGRVEIVETDAVDWLTARVAATYGIHEDDGTDSEYPLGVFLAASPDRRSTSGSVSRSIDLLDKLCVLDQDRVAASYVVDASGVVTTAVATLLTSAGITRSAITPSTEVLGAARVWDAGTSKLTIVNDLLASINYFALRADANGILVAEPYLAPESRPLAWELFDGDSCVYVPSVTVGADYYSVANKVVLVATTPDAVLTSTATLDASSPYSFATRGRWIVDYRTVEATSQTILDAMAARILADGVRVTETVVVSHPYLPFTLHDAIRFRCTRLALDGRYAVVGQRHDLKVGGLVTSTLRKAGTA
jgi:hypothetical protein